MEAGAGLGAIFEALMRVLSFGETSVYALVAVFARIGAIATLLPGFGEQTLPARVKLAVAIAFTAIVWPAVMPEALASPALDRDGMTALALLPVLFAEAVAGLMVGLAVRFLVMALQLAGTIAAQSTSVSQIFGGGATPDPMPAIGNILTIAGIALALALGLHVKAAAAMISSYEVVPFGRLPFGGDAAAWGAEQASTAFSLAFSLAAPFLIASFAYNLALGAINRAMPQLMVAFVGAPAITGAAMGLLALSAPVLLEQWLSALDMALARPLGVVP